MLRPELLIDFVTASFAASFFFFLRELSCYVYFTTVMRRLINFERSSLKERGKMVVLIPVVKVAIVRTRQCRVDGYGFVLKRSSMRLPSPPPPPYEMKRQQQKENEALDVRQRLNGANL